MNIWQVIYNYPHPSKNPSGLDCCPVYGNDILFVFHCACVFSWADPEGGDRGSKTSPEKSQKIWVSWQYNVLNNLKCTTTFGSSLPHHLKKKQKVFRFGIPLAIISGSAHVFFVLGPFCSIGLRVPGLRWYRTHQHMSKKLPSFDMLKNSSKLVYFDRNNRTLPCFLKSN